MNAKATWHKWGLLAIPVLGAGFGCVGGFALGHHLAPSAFGLVWGVLALFVAPVLARRGANSPSHANAPIYVMLPLACMAFGGAVLGHLTGSTSQSLLYLLQQPGYGLYFYTLHAAFEWLLLPWALMVNWTYPRRRRVLLVLATLFYLGRIASAIYFAPNAMEWGSNPTDAAGHESDIVLWLRLDLIRVVLQDFFTATLIMILAIHPALQFRDTRGKFA